MPSEEEKQACLQWVANGQGSNIDILPHYTTTPPYGHPFLKRRGIPDVRTAAM